jgi:hypothetical protein
MSRNDGPTYKRPRKVVQEPTPAPTPPPTPVEELPF